MHKILKLKLERPRHRQCLPCLPLTLIAVSKTPAAHFELRLIAVTTAPRPGVALRRGAPRRLPSAIAMTITADTPAGRPRPAPGVTVGIAIPVMNFSGSIVVALQVPHAAKHRLWQIDRTAKFGLSVNTTSRHMLLKRGLLEAHAWMV